jgi:hypothetical protein
MSQKISIVVTPSSEVSAALDKAFLAFQKSDAAKANGKSGRAAFEFKIPGANSSLHIIRIEPTEREKKGGKGPKDHGPAASKKAQAAKRPRYMCTAYPSEYLLGKRALVGGAYVKQLATLQSALYRAGMKAWLPSLEIGVLMAIKNSECALTTVSFPYYFELGDETEAYKTLQDLHRHAEIVLDCATKPPTRTKVWKKLLPRVHSSPDCRHAFSITLPFGTAHVSLKREHDELPSTIRDSESENERNEIVQRIRSILCIEIEVEISKFSAVDEDGMEIPLPTDSDQWTAAHLQVSPMVRVWDEFRRVLWLDISLATDESDAIDATLSDPLKVVLQRYLSGEDVRENALMLNKPEQFHKYRNVLIAKSHVDILNPWAINQLNLSERLGPIFAFENRLVLRDSAELHPHALVAENIDDAIATFSTLMAGSPGWFYDPAN